MLSRRRGHVADMSGRVAFFFSGLLSSSQSRPPSWCSSRRRPPRSPQQGCALARLGKDVLSLALALRLGIGISRCDGFIVLLSATLLMNRSSSARAPPFLFCCCLPSFTGGLDGRRLGVVICWRKDLTSPPLLMALLSVQSLVCCIDED
jgi:hypothetical protein